jgi:translation machinery-associated protein 16
MPNNKRKTAKTVKGKDTLHPGSRKAGQMDRILLRSEKLKRESKLRKENFRDKRECDLIL